MSVYGYEVELREVDSEITFGTIKDIVKAAVGDDAFASVNFGGTRGKSTGRLITLEFDFDDDTVDAKQTEIEGIQASIEALGDGVLKARQRAVAEFDGNLTLTDVGADLGVQGAVIPVATNVSVLLQVGSATGFSVKELSPLVMTVPGVNIADIKTLIGHIGLRGTRLDPEAANDHRRFAAVTESGTTSTQPFDDTGAQIGPPTRLKLKPKAF